MNENMHGKRCFFICIIITGASRLKCYNKQGMYISIRLWCGSPTAVRSILLFAVKKRPEREIFPAMSCFMCFSWVKNSLVCILLLSNGSFPGPWLTRNVAVMYAAYWIAAESSAALTDNTWYFVVLQAANACCGWFIPEEKQRHTVKLKGKSAPRGTWVISIREWKPANKYLLLLVATGGAAGPTSPFPEAWH